jgi:AcrR family transcriptional regulator
MSEAASPAPKPRVGRTAQGRRQVRSKLTLAALDLFASQGFEATTVDQIADAAGVGRRTFFRYFRSKEDVVFPDHEERLAEVVELLEAADVSEPPLMVVSRTAEIVLEMYLVEPEVSLKRFELTRQVPSLRDKEIASIDRYQRVFARYLRARYEAHSHGALRASVAAASVVAAHNHVLREWLKSGGAVDALQVLREALRLVRGALAESWDDGDVESPGQDQVVVGVVRTDASAGVVMKQLEDALRDLPRQ